MNWHDLRVEDRLFRAIYRSRCLCGPEQEREILESARRNNQRTGITGVLVSHAGWFLQILEGPAQAVSNLTVLICDDPRNGEFFLLHGAFCDRREFGEWSMASTQLDDRHFAEVLNGFADSPLATCRVVHNFVAHGEGKP